MFPQQAIDKLLLRQGLINFCTSGYRRALLAKSVHRDSADSTALIEPAPNTADAM